MSVIYISDTFGKKLPDIIKYISNNLNKNDILELYNKPNLIITYHFNSILKRKKKTLTKDNFDISSFISKRDFPFNHKSLIIDYNGNKFQQMCSFLYNIYIEDHIDEIVGVFPIDIWKNIISYHKYPLKFRLISKKFCYIRMDIESLFIRLTINMRHNNVYNLLRYISKEDLLVLSKSKNPYIIHKLNNHKKGKENFSCYGLDSSLKNQHKLKQNIIKDYLEEKNIKYTTKYISESKFMLMQPNFFNIVDFGKTLQNPYDIDFEEIAEKYGYIIRHKDKFCINLFLSKKNINTLTKKELLDFDK